MKLVKQIDDKMTSNVGHIKPGFIVKVYQKIKEGGKDRIQIFEGLVIARKGGKGPNATFTVRKNSYGVFVERIYPLFSPNIEKVEVINAQVVRKAKLYYVREKQDGVPNVRKNKIKKPNFKS